MKRLLIANRGEIAIRIARSARAMGIETVAVYAKDEAGALHVTKADASHPLQGTGVPAYLDIEALIEIAAALKCDALHPGVGFLSEDPALATACLMADLTFIGPNAFILGLFGDKLSARALAAGNGIPTLLGTAITSDEELAAFLATLPPDSGVMVKARGGGGGRGMRLVKDLKDLDLALSRCRKEALAASGNPGLYLEQYLPKARHIEVQLLGDGLGVSHLWTRECSLQRRHQKLIEFAPAPWLSPALEAQLLDAALTLGRAAPFCGVMTAEFLISPSDTFYFIEINPRLQVEHTVTEAVTGVDLVEIQLQLAQGLLLPALHLDKPLEPRGFALQARVNMERFAPASEGHFVPTSGTLERFAIPSGPGVRVDTMGYTGYQTTSLYDSLLAKIIAHGRDIEQLFKRSYQALCETQIEGIETNISLLQSLVSHPEVQAGRSTTGFVESHIQALATTTHPMLYPATAANPSEAPPEATGWAGAEIDNALVAPMDGTIVQLPAVDTQVAAGSELVVLSAMKMEHVIAAPSNGRVAELLADTGQIVRAGQPLLVLAEGDGSELAATEAHTHDLSYIRADLAEVLERRAAVQDAARPTAVEKRHSRSQRTARENIADLCDKDSFVEYGALALAAQRGTQDLPTLIKRTPADGIITGLGTINGAAFTADRTRCAVLSYDYTVMAGTQGYQGHRKTDRLLHVAKEALLPVVFFTEGGGGRPSDTDLINIMVSGLECASFRELASLQGLVPLVGINNGRCFAGNAALLGCCDIIIATESSNIGMGGPAMIEGGGLGQFRPEDVGPIEDQLQSGVVDIVVKDEAGAVAVAKTYLGYFQGASAETATPDQRLLRQIIPENRLRIYDIHDVLEALFDEDSLLELQPHYATGMLTALARVEGHPMGVIANNPAVLAGAIDTPGARKAARFMKLCEQFRLPLLFLCDTPGIMVGPEAEKSGTVRAAAAMFLEAAKLTIPFGTIVLRKAYGLGAQAMAGGHFKAPRFIASWPTGEFGPMGLEGAVRLGFRRQLAAIEDKMEREEMFQQMVDMLYERGKALNIASLFEIDDVIDPIDTRQWLRTLCQA